MKFILVIALSLLLTGCFNTDEVNNDPNVDQITETYEEELKKFETALKEKNIELTREDSQYGDESDLQKSVFYSENNTDVGFEFRIYKENSNTLNKIIETNKFSPKNSEIKLTAYVSENIVLIPIGIPDNRRIIINIFKEI